MKLSFIIIEKLHLSVYVTILRFLCGDSYSSSCSWADRVGLKIICIKMSFILRRVSWKLLLTYIDGVVAFIPQFLALSIAKSMATADTSASAGVPQLYLCMHWSSRPPTVCRAGPGLPFYVVRHTPATLLPVTQPIVVDFDISQTSAGDALLCHIHRDVFPYPLHASVGRLADGPFDGVPISRNFIRLVNAHFHLRL